MPDWKVRFIMNRRQSSQWSAAALALATVALAVINTSLPVTARSAPPTGIGEGDSKATAAEQPVRAGTGTAPRRELACHISLHVEVEPSALPSLESGDPDVQVRTTGITIGLTLTTGKVQVYCNGQTRAWLHEYREQSGELIRILQRPEGAYVAVGKQAKLVRTTQPFPYVEGSCDPGEWLDWLLGVSRRPDVKGIPEKIAWRQALRYELSDTGLGCAWPGSAGNPGAGDFSTRVRVWVDVETSLPHCFEIQQVAVTPTGTTRLSTRCEDLNWNPGLAPASFAPPTEADRPPLSGYQVQTAEEPPFLEALREWLALGKIGREAVDKLKQGGASAYAKQREGPAVEIFPEIDAMFEAAGLGSSYPARLDSAWLASALASRALLIRMAEVSLQGPPSPNSIILSALYRRLVSEGRHPQYVGAKLTPGDPKAVLLRWKVDGQHDQVIYGDLRVETVAD
jgi:hypothetical protein